MAATVARRWSVGNPHPEHEPVVGRIPTGTTMRGGRRFGTSLRCSCGGDRTRVSNSAPSSRTGRRAVQASYALHLAAVGEACPACLGPMTHDLGPDDVCTSCGKVWERLDPLPEPGEIPCL